MISFEIQAFMLWNEFLNIYLIKLQNLDKKAS